LSANKKKGAWGGKRPGAGRKKLPDAERHDVQLLIKMRPAEAEALRKLAEDAGVGPGVYVRELVRRHLKRGGK
jgi:hypothetical protein